MNFTAGNIKSFFFQKIPLFTLAISFCYISYFLLYLFLYDRKNLKFFGRILVSRWRRRRRLHRRRPNTFSFRNLNFSKSEWKSMKF